MDLNGLRDEETELLGELWAQHPRYFVVPAESDFLHKAEQALTIIFEQLPACCRERMAARSS